MKGEFFNSGLVVDSYKDTKKSAPEKKHFFEY